MSHWDIWQTLEQVGIFITQRDGAEDEWGYTVHTARLSIEWKGPYSTREQTFQAVLTWLMNITIEHLSLSDRQHTHIYSVQPPAHSAEIYRFDLLLEGEVIVDTALYDEELLVVLGDEATVVYNEETARVEFQSSLPEYLWCVWERTDSEGWVFCHPDGRQILVQVGDLFPTIYREVAPLLGARRSEDLPR
jgi:hypothetical protein